MDPPVRLLFRACFPPNSIAFTEIFPLAILSINNRPWPNHRKQARPYLRQTFFQSSRIPRECIQRRGLWILPFRRSFVRWVVFCLLFSWLSVQLGLSLSIEAWFEGVFTSVLLDEKKGTQKTSQMIVVGIFGTYSSIWFVVQFWSATSVLLWYEYSLYCDGIEGVVYWLLVVIVSKLLL